MKIFDLFSLLILVIFLMSCSSPDKKGEETKAEAKTEVQLSEISGKVIVVGNEPFTKVAILVDDTTSYILNCSKEIEKELRSKQGDTIKVTYGTKKDTPEGEVLNVTKFEN